VSLLRVWPRGFVEAYPDILIALGKFAFAPHDADEGADYNDAFAGDEGEW
jgi:hypothetical protein